MNDWLLWLALTVCFVLVCLGIYYIFRFFIPHADASKRSRSI